MPVSFWSQSHLRFGNASGTISEARRFKLTLGPSVRKILQATWLEKVSSQFWKVMGQKAKLVPTSTRYQLVLARLTEVSYRSSTFCLERPGLACRA